MTDPRSLAVEPTVIDLDDRPRPAVTPIHTLWIGEALGPLEWLCLTSWVRLGYAVVLHSYDAMAMPEGVERFDAAGLCPREKIFRNRRNGSLAVFSDVYRALILRNFPAVWLDADIFLVRPIDFSAGNILAYEGGRDLKHINNAVMKLESGHAILAEIVRRFHKPLTAIDWRKRGKKWQVLVKAVLSLGLHPKDLPWGALGARAIEHQIRRQGFEGQILGPELCLTAARVPLFQPIEEAAAALAEPVAYVHLYRSHLHVDLARPVAGSVYARLWEIAGLTPQLLSTPA